MSEVVVSGVLSGILGTLLGLFLGHRLSLGRDKRKEFNQATEGVRKQLIDEQSKFCGNCRISENDVLNIRTKLGAKNSKSIELSYKKFQTTFRETFKFDTYGRVSVNEPNLSAYKRSVSRFLKAVEAR